MKEAIRDFLKKHMLSPDCISPEDCAEIMLRHMRAGLAGTPVDMPMIPTHLKGLSSVPQHKAVMVIDAGGTNFRAGLAEFDESGCRISGLKKDRMPGTGTPVTWDEFISYVADSLLPLADRTDTVGFCFSYDAEITPEIDGKVLRIDKEVVVNGCEGQLVGASLSKALAERGFPGKRVIILNDTVAALLGGACSIDLSRYSDFTGMICGTGINTCSPAANSIITKLSLPSEGSMLINFEAGCFSAMPRGDVDELVDRRSHVPGEKLMEKMCSGAYVGKVCRAALEMAAEEKLISDAVLPHLDLFDKYSGAITDSLAVGVDEYGIFAAEDLDCASEIAKAIFRRSARCMAAVILAIMLMNDSGKTEEHPMCVCAEGSLVSRSHYFLPELKNSLQAIGAGKYRRFAVVIPGQDTTLPGAAVAALLNT